MYWNDFYNSESLPNEWDRLYENHPLFIKQFLSHLEKTNAVPQKHYFKRIASNSYLTASFYRGVFPVRLGHVVAKPKATYCSLPMPFHSEKGFRPVGCINKIAALMDGLWPGLQLIVGMKEKGENIKGWTWKRQLVTLTMLLKYTSLDQYIGEMRSKYRNKTVARRENWKDVTVFMHRGMEFTQSEYSLYCDLVRSVKYPTELMSIDYFRNITVPHIYLKATLGNTIIAWALLMPYEKEIYMLFCGINKKHQKHYDSYHNLLLEVVKYCIAEKYEKIHFGQTAEIAKQEIGAVLEERFMLIRHSNPMVNCIVAKTALFNNRAKVPKQHIFKAQTRL